MECLNKYRFLIVLILFAAALRILGIWHGYPFSYYPDEAHFVKRALSFGSGDLNPHWFHKPAFLMYLLFFEYGFLFVVGKAVSAWNSVDQFAVSFILNPGPFYVLGRLTIAVFSLANILVVYFLGERFIQRGVGFFAAILLTLSLGDVAASQDIKADIPAAFFTILSAYFVLAYMDSGRLKLILIAAAIAGCGAATKYYSYAMLVPIGIALLTRIDYSGFHPLNIAKQALARGAFVILAFFVTFFLLSPFNFLDPLGRASTFGRLERPIQTLAAILGLGEEPETVQVAIRAGTTRVESILDYVETLVATSGMGWIIGGICLAGLCLLAFRRSASTRVLLVFPIIFGLISTVVYPGYAETRHQLPLYPFLAVCGGFLIVVLRARLSRPWPLYVVFSSLMLIPAYSIVERGIHLSKTDTRNIAKYWIEENIPAKTKIVMDEMGPVLNPTFEQLSAQLILAENADPDGQFTAHYDRYIQYQLGAASNATTYHIEEIRFPWWRDNEPLDGIYELDENDVDMGNPLRLLGVKSLDRYADDGFEIFILSSERYAPFLKVGNYRYEHFPSFRRFYQDIFLRGELIKKFDPALDNRPGPTIRIMRYKRPAG